MDKIVTRVYADLVDLSERILAERRIATVEQNTYSIIAMNDLLGKVNEMLEYMQQEEVYEASDDLNRRFREATGKDMF